MQLVTPEALSAFIKREKATLLTAWEHEARQLSDAKKMKRAILHDHLPLLIDELADELQQPEKSRERLAAFSAAHGAHRQQNGFHIAQLVEEYKLLRRCIVERAEAEGLAVAGKANRVVDELIDESIKQSIETYVEHRDTAEKKRREEYLKFLVHDLRSPLSAIYYAILLIERELETASVSERVWTIQGVIKRNIEQMQALIVKLLQEEQNIRTATNIRLDRAPIELVSVADNAVRVLTSLAAISETQIVNEIPESIMVNVDADLLERVFQNLISNAIDNTPKGTITISAHRTKSGAVECRIADNGKGIPEEIRGRIFEKFVTASKHRSGIGLGLPISKQIIEAHGGTIDIQSEVGKGTVVRFTIPAN